MKLKSVNKVAFFTSLLLITVFSAFTPGPIFRKKALFATWNYQLITKNGKPVNAISPEDTMILQKNGRFQYAIKNLNKNESGRFEIIHVPLDSSPYKKALRFTYNQKSGNYRRLFNIMHLSDSMVIREGTTTFHYKLRKP
jgi:hypothetical protein